MLVRYASGFFGVKVIVCRAFLAAVAVTRARARDLPRGRRADGQGGSGVTRINAARLPSEQSGRGTRPKEGNAEMCVVTSLLRGRLILDGSV